MISIIIPTLNAEAVLPGLLERLEEQQGIPDREVLIIDSSSSDQTQQIARNAGARLFVIAREEFDHGGTRTRAARLAAGEFLVFLTQDALPDGPGALAQLLEPFRHEPRVAAVYGRQLANSDATVFSEHLRLFNYPDTGYVRSWEDRDRHGFRTIFISNSFAAYRKDALAGAGYFPGRLLFGEDTRTVANMLEQGWLVCYAAGARVFHSHNYSVVGEFKRYFDIGVFHVDQKDLLQKFGSPTGAGKRFVRSEISFLLHRKRYILVPLSIVRSAAKFLAYSIGKRYRLLPRCMARSFSMQPRWWNP